MTDKKRTTVTTIETQEVWIVRKVVPGVGNETEMHPPIEIPRTLPVSRLGEIDDSSQTNEDES